MGLYGSRLQRVHLNHGRDDVAVPMEGVRGLQRGPARGGGWGRQEISRAAGAYFTRMPPRTRMQEKEILLAVSSSSRQPALLAPIPAQPGREPPARPWARRHRPLRHCNFAAGLGEGLGEGLGCHDTRTTADA